ncbi:MAG TPA: AAA family ATPase [Trebonia sp.]|jgi:DNA-binding CsgD family transcriptional regulator|nr:AAA family ATPase [Trebonia sp.]
MPAVSGDFVRAAEWRRVRDFATAVNSREWPAVLAISGEAGAGKSRLWRAAVDRAESADPESACRVLRSEPSASEADTPFAGLSDLLSGVLPSVSADIPAPQLEALEVALLMRPAGEQPPAAHAIGRAVLTALTTLLASGPALLAVDDVQWLDEGSLEALEFALRRSAGPLSVLLGARTEAPADPLTVGAPPLALNWRRLLNAVPASTEVTLAPLKVAQVQRLLPPTASPAQARLVTLQSRGNPFWAVEIWTDITSPAPGAAPALVVAPAPEAESERVAAPDGPPAPLVPPLARAALAGRLERSLTGLAARVPAIVAAAGRITVADTLAVLADLAGPDDQEDPAAAVDAAVVAGVVVETDGRLAAAHPLIGAAAIDAMPPVRRTRLYQRLAAVASGPERRAQFLARAAGTVPDPEVAAALDAAAEAAYGRAARSHAGKYAAQAVTFTPEDDDAGLIRRRIRAGELLSIAGELTESLEYLEPLDVGTLPTPDAERVVPLLTDFLEFVRGQTAATAVLTEALDAARAARSADGTVDDRRMALLLSLACDPVYGLRDGRRAAAVDAIRHAEAAGPDANASLHRALVYLAYAKGNDDGAVDAALLDRAERLEPLLPGIPVYATADKFRGELYRYTDDLDASRAAYGRLLARAREAGDEFAVASFLASLATTEQLAGDHAAAREAIQESDTIFTSYNWPMYPTALEPRVMLLIADGELDEALRLTDEHLPDSADQPARSRFMGAALRGKISAAAMDAAGIVRNMELAARFADEVGHLEPGARSRIDHMLGEAYAITGQPEGAARISARLRGLGVRAGRPTLTGDADRIDALIAAAGGDLDSAAELAQAAIAAHEQSQLRPELARSLAVFGRVERRRKARAHSRDALRRALDLAREIGHQPLLASIEAELPRTVAARSDSALTDAERRVAEQIVSGATSREAAEKLFISARTVEAHLASIYRKLGVHSRSELRRALSIQLSRTLRPIGVP